MERFGEGLELGEMEREIGRSVTALKTKRARLLAKAQMLKISKKYDISICLSQLIINIPENSDIKVINDNFYLILKTNSIIIKDKTYLQIKLNKIEITTKREENTQDYISMLKRHNIEYNK